MTKQFIICSAIIYRGTVVCGRRHSDAIETLESLIPNEDCLNLDYKSIEKGFIDNYGQFHDRKNAWIIAEKADQIKYGKNTQDPNSVKELISENLFMDLDDEEELVFIGKDLN